ncbi:MAG: ferredoxin [Bdellovibrionaceae bacterium]|nr:ferredoxin [Pseudobdellovibrionaceae bacterium]
MADKNKKYKQNRPGAYYVDTECINCDACLLSAENHFKINEEEGFAYVYKQPQTEQERLACEEALEACPVEAIGNDGET